MKKQILIIMTAAVLCTSLLSGCGKKKVKEEKKILTPADMHPSYYTDENKIPSGTYCIAHKMNSKKNDLEVRYYPLYKAESFGSPDNEATGGSGKRYFWLNYNYDEGKIPTFYPGDRIIFKSSSKLPGNFIMEKFFDEGYTVGVGGLYENSSERPAFNTGNDGCMISVHSDARILEKIAKNSGGDDDSDSKDSVEIVFNTINKEKITMDMIDMSGMIYGLEEGKKNSFDLRIGTKSYPVTMTSNIHQFRLGETYKSKDFDYVTSEMIRVNLPDYLTTGYYEINGAGAFRFLKTEKSYKDLTAKDYNDFIYTYSGDRPTGSQDGRVLNDDGYLVSYEEYMSQVAADDREEYGTNETSEGYDEDSESDEGDTPPVNQDQQQTETGSTETPGSEQTGAGTEEQNSGKSGTEDRDTENGKSSDSGSPAAKKKEAVK